MTAYFLGLNRNLLYLSMLFSVLVIMTVILRRWWAVLLGLGACGYLAMASAKVEELRALFPAPRDIPGAEKLWATGIGEGETWSYRFALGDPGRRGEGADPVGHLYIDGRGLSSLVVGVQGRILMASDFCSKKNGLDHVAIPLGGGQATALTVSLRGMPRTIPRIFHGPEVHGFNEYRDAVWLEFDGNGIRAVYHAQRAVAEAEPK